jgi:CDP-diacylglycerol--glycerol-3-phosphate 3-phosphatidyltransferase
MARPLPQSGQRENRLTLPLAADRPALARLRWAWAALAVGGILSIGAAYFLLSDAWAARYALRWSALAGLALVYVLIVLWRHLPENHPPAEPDLLPALGLPNLISLARGFMLAALAGFLLSPPPEGWLAWAPGTLYTAAIVVDYLDGVAARLTGRSTVLGQTLDLEFDALGILIAPLVAVWHGQLPAWFLLASAARYVYAAGIWLRRRAGKPVYDLTPSTTRRALAGIQMGFISAALWPVLRPDAIALAAGVVIIPFLAGFVRDWLVVSGAVRPDSAGYRRVMDVAGRIFRGWLPVGLRAIVAAVMLGAWAGVMFPAYRATLAHGMALQIGLLALTVAGVAGRLAATLLLIVTGLALAGSGLNPGAALVVASTSGLMVLGGGALTLWRPDEVFLARRYGGNGDD